MLEDGAEITVTRVFWYTLFMALAAGLGAIPFFFVDAMKASWKGTANALACGVMLAASFDLIHEGQQYGEASVIGGIIFGALFVKISQEFLEKYEDVSITDMKGADARKAMLMVGIMTLHAFGEGSGVGVSFSGQSGLKQGTLVTLAIGIHNIPEGLAVAMVLAARGASAKSALFWSIVSSIPQPLVAVPAFIFVQSFTPLLPFGLGFAAGSMIWMVFAELIPDSLEEASASSVANAATAAATFMEGFRMLLDRLSNNDDGDDSKISSSFETILINITSGFLGYVLVELLRVLGQGSRAGMASMLGCCSGSLLAYGSANMYTITFAQDHSKATNYLLLQFGCGILGAYAVVSILRRIVPGTWITSNGAHSNGVHTNGDILPNHVGRNLSGTKRISLSTVGLVCGLFILTLESIREGVGCASLEGNGLIHKALRSFPKAVFAGAAGRIIVVGSTWQCIAIAAAIASVEDLSCAWQLGSWIGSPSTVIGIQHIAVLSGCMIGVAMLTILPQGMSSHCARATLGFLGGLCVTLMCIASIFMLEYAQGIEDTSLTVDPQI